MIKKANAKKWGWIMHEADKLKVLIVASEITPYAKSGGLGDVVGSLPKELKNLGVDVRVVFPKYSFIKDSFLKELEYINSFSVTLGWRNQGAAVYSLKSAEVPTYLLGNDYYFSRDGLYGYGDDFERFAFFSKASLEFLNCIDFIPDVIHYNDWQTGLAPIYLRDCYGGFLAFSKIKSVLTIHNLQYQGLFGREILGAVGLNDGYFTPDKMEFNGAVSLLKGGLVYADKITTVSETYAHEVQTSQYGYGMDGILRAQAHKFLGIVNGIDTIGQDPKTNKYIYYNFDKNNLDNKKKNKRALQEELNLPKRDDVPIISIISRLVDQKGFDLISVAMEEIISKDIQLVVLGTGEGRYENMFKHIAWRVPDKVSANIYFSEELAQKVYAASDMFLMPSLFEPCGLGQIFAMRYGTIPIVRRTGGLNDTVSHYNIQTKEGTGFLFNDYDAYGMMWAVKEALSLYYNDKDSWNRLIKNAMDADFSWTKSAEKYIELYNSLKNNG